MEYGMAMGDVPVKNWREAYWDAGPDRLGGTTVADTILTKTHSCHACPVHCKRIVKIDTGPYAMEEGPGSEYETAAALGTLQRMDNMDANHKANELCNRHGMDTISMGGTIAYAVEAYQNGLITDQETGGLKLDFGDPDLLLKLIELTASREGIGDALAEGSRAASERFGGAEYAIHVKGLECPMHDPRALWSVALTYATSIRGACHCADNNMYADMGITSHKDLGIKRSWPFKAKGKAAQTVGSQIKGTLSNSAVICQYVWGVAGGTPELLEMINASTGSGYDLDQIVAVANRIWYLKRAIGNLCGATRADDRLPRRILEPHPEEVTSNLTTVMFPTYMSMAPTAKLMRKLGNDTIMNLTRKMADKLLFPNIDKVIRATRFLPGLWGHNKALKAGDAAEIERRTVPFESMLEEFYGLPDIDEKGRPSRARLESLGLSDVAEQLYSV
jgi:aldehyde:ferredoxin oxidoreductase